MAIAMLAPLVVVTVLVAAAMAGARIAFIAAVALFAIAPLFFYLRQVRRCRSLAAFPPDEAIRDGVRAIVRQLRWTLWPFLPADWANLDGVTSGADLVALEKAAAAARVYTLGPALLTLLVIFGIGVEDALRKGPESMPFALFLWAVLGMFVADRVGFAVYVRNVVAAAKTRFAESSQGAAP